jgi:hypothetical protein
MKELTVKIIQLLILVCVSLTDAGKALGAAK